MNAITIWLGIPFIIAIFAFFLRRYPDLAYPLVLMTCILLIGFSLFVTIDEPFSLGESTIVVGSSAVLLGRLIEMDAESMSFVNFFYFITFIWMFVAWRIRPNRFFPGFGLFINVSLLGALFIQPAFYAGFIFLIVAFLFVPLWVQAGSIPSRGVYRFLVMMFFGMPFFFLAGWQFSNVQLGLDNSNYLLQGGILLSLGVLSFLSAFPMHSWIPMISEDSHPIILGFFMTTFPNIVMRFFLNQAILNDFMVVMGTQFQFIWLIVAVITLFVGGLGMAISKKFVRFLAYYLIFSVGIGLAGMSLFNKDVLMMQQIWWLATIVNVVIFISMMNRFEDVKLNMLGFDSITVNEKTSRPILVAFLALLPMLALPFSMGFVGFFGIFEQVGRVVNWAAMFMIISLLGAFIFVGRFLIQFVSKISWQQFHIFYSNDEEKHDSEMIVQNRWMVFGFSIIF